VYRYSVKSNYDRESYFVINRPFSELFFREPSGERKAEEATAIILLLLIFTFSFAMASVSVGDYTIDKAYSPFENITGGINLVIDGEAYDELITSNDDDVISLGEFLERSGNLFECSPRDCSTDYTFSGGW